LDSVATTTADITARDLTITAKSDTKVYDGGIASDETPNVSGLQSGDSIAGLLQTYDNKNVGTGKTMSVSAYTVNDGNSGNNYSISLGTNTAGVITQKVLTVSGITANDKPFDGNTVATLNLGGAGLVGVIGPDAVTLNTAGATGMFITEIVGGPKLVTIVGLTIGGAGAGNYSLSQPPARASITAWSLSGFLPPVGVANTYHDALIPSSPIWNTIKGGQTVPLKFNLFTSVGGTQLTSINDVKEFVLVSMSSCSAGPEDPVETEAFTSTGGTTLRYDGSQFIQNWQTPKATKQQCYRLTMTARDGSQLSAFFKAK
jgi:hypothetical protein